MVAHVERTFELCGELANEFRFPFSQIIRLDYSWAVELMCLLGISTFGNGVISHSTRQRRVDILVFHWRSRSYGQLVSSPGNSKYTYYFLSSSLKNFPSEPLANQTASQRWDDEAGSRRRRKTPGNRLLVAWCRILWRWWCHVIRSRDGRHSNRVRHSIHR